MQTGQHVYVQDFVVQFARLEDSVDRFVGDGELEEIQ